MNLTPPQWDAVCAALSPKWPDEVCLIDLEFNPGRSQNWYRRRWGRGASAVSSLVRDRSETGPRQVDPVELSEEVGELPSDEGLSKIGPRPVRDSFQTALVEPVHRDTVYTYTTTPKGVDSNTDLSTSEVKALRDATRRKLRCNGVDMRWTKRNCERLQQLLELVPVADVALVLDWWSASDDERPRQLRGQEEWPGGRVQVRAFKTIARNFEDYLDLATTTSVPTTNIHQPTSSNPIARVLRKYHDS